MGTRLPELIEDEGIALRRWTPADAEAVSLAVAESTEHLRPWMPWIAEEPLTIEQRRGLHAEREREWADGGDVNLAMLVDGRVVGCCGMHRRVGPDALELGYWVHPAFTRRGLATRVARLLTTTAFTLPGVEHVEIHHDRANKASSGVPKRLGFQFVCESPDERTAPGESGIEWIWRMDRRVWARSRRVSIGGATSTSEYLSGC